MSIYLEGCCDMMLEKSCFLDLKIYYILHYFGIFQQHAASLFNTFMHEKSTNLKKL